VVGNNQQPGLFHIANSNNNRVYGVAGTNRLIVDQNYVIRGAGQIGINQMRLTNYGVFDAVYSNSMTLDLSGGDNYNFGTLQADQGATLTLLNSTFSAPGAAGGPGGLVLAKDGSFVNISGTTLIDQTFDTEGSGIVRMTGTTSLVNPLNLGRLDQSNAVQTTIQ